MPSASMLLLTILIIFFRAFLTSFITYKELGETDHVASVGKKLQCKWKQGSDVMRRGFYFKCNKNQHSFYHGSVIL